MFNLDLKVLAFIKRVATDPVYQFMVLFCILLALGIAIPSRVKKSAN